MMNWTTGEVMHGVTSDGSQLRATVFDENQVRAAAGITMAAGAIAFVLANYDKVFWPIRIVTTLFFIDFLIRVTVGLKYSPAGALACWLVRRQQPQWVSAKPKRFAWTLGLVMSSSMMIITNAGIHGALPRTICLICLVLMWLESVLGVCLGCEIHGLMVRRGWTTKDEAFEICSHGACDIVAPDVVVAAPHCDEWPVSRPVDPDRVAGLVGGSGASGPGVGVRPRRWLRPCAAGTRRQ